MNESANYPHAELTGKIIKCCMEAHSFLGPGLPEATYHKAVLKEMSWAHLPFESEREVAVVWRAASQIPAFDQQVFRPGETCQPPRSIICANLRESGESED